MIASDPGAPIAAPPIRRGVNRQRRQSSDRRATYQARRESAAKNKPEA